VVLDFSLQPRAMSGCPFLAARTLGDKGSCDAVQLHTEGARLAEPKGRITPTCLAGSYLSKGRRVAPNASWCGRYLYLGIRDSAKRFNVNQAPWPPEYKVGMKRLGKSDSREAVLPTSEDRRGLRRSSVGWQRDLVELDGLICQLKPQAFGDVGWAFPPKTRLARAIHYQNRAQCAGRCLSVPPSRQSHPSVIRGRPPIT
jgi:hypothetical protein